MYQSFFRIYEVRLEIAITFDKKDTRDVGNLIVCTSMVSNWKLEVWMCGS